MLICKSSVRAVNKMDEKQPLLKNNENQSQVDVENAGRHLKKIQSDNFSCVNTDIDLKSRITFRFIIADPF